MKPIIKLINCFIISVILFSCSKEKNTEYDKILESLKNNYTVTCTAESPFLLCWNKNKIAFLQDSIDYQSGVKNFFNQDNTFLKYILKKNSKTMNQYITIKNLCEATIFSKNDLTNDEAKKILIDNLLTNNFKDTIIINKYIFKVQIDTLKKIIHKNVDIKNKYLEYLANSKITYTPPPAVRSIHEKP